MSNEPDKLDKTGERDGKGRFVPGHEGKGGRPKGLSITALIKEELDELKKAIDNKDLLEVADALTDILYVTYGAGHAFGINLDKCFDEVQNSNMSKLDDNGKPIYNDAGKVMKGPKYFKPDLSKFLK